MKDTASFVIFENSFKKYSPKGLCNFVSPKITCIDFTPLLIELKKTSGHKINFSAGVYFKKTSSALCFSILNNYFSLE